MYEEFLRTYRGKLFSAIEGLDAGEFRKFAEILIQAYKDNKQIFVIGNGGSAAAGNHFVCDFGKNSIVYKEAKRFKILSLCDNIEIITAIGNDIGFEEIFAFQLNNLMNREDVLLIISASGNSPDVVRAAEYATAMSGKIVCLTGFSGGKVKKHADAWLNIPLESYEQIEDVHLIILHEMICFIKNNNRLLYNIDSEL